MQSNIYITLFKLFRHCANALNNCHQERWMPEKTYSFFFIQNKKARVRKKEKNTLNAKKKILGSFTVFITIPFNIVIPIRNVLCYFWRRFTCLSLSFFSSARFENPEKIHIFIFCATNKHTYIHVNFFSPLRRFESLNERWVRWVFLFAGVFSQASNKNIGK